MGGKFCNPFSAKNFNRIRGNMYRANSAQTINKKNHPADLVLDSLLIFTIFVTPTGFKPVTF